MPCSSRRICCLTMLCLQCACSAQMLPAGVRREHYDPAYLNEAAVAALVAGDRGTAAILLERAAVLAPQDTLIRENLAALRQGGAVHLLPARATPATAPATVPATATAPAPSTKAAPTAGTAIDPALPAMGIWPLK